MLRDIASLIQTPDDEIHVVIPDHGPLENEFLALGSVVVDPLYPDELPYWREVKRLTRRLKLLDRIRPDIVYCNTIHAAKWLAYARVRRIPAIMHVHELAGGFAELGFAERMIVRNLSNRIIAVSDAVRTYLVAKQGISPEKISVVRAGVRVERFGRNSTSEDLRQTLGLRRNFVIGTVGRIASVKGSDLLIELALRVRNMMTAGEGVKFLVVCTTDDRTASSAFFRRLSESGLKNDFVIVEDVPDVVPYYGVMDLFLSTSREDPFPLVVLEAMASRLPVVAFNVGGIPEAVDRKSGVLIPPFDLQYMTETVVDLMRDPGRRSLLGANGRTRVEREFDLRQNAGNIRRIIETLVR